MNPSAGAYGPGIGEAIRQAWVAIGFRERPAHPVIAGAIEYAAPIGGRPIQGYCKKKSLKRQKKPVFRRFWKA